jgi:acyl-CoA thioesterase-2
VAASLEALLRLLDLEQLEVDLFRGAAPETELQRVFGGQVAGQALVAAGRTVDADRHVHSLHAYFLRPGDPNRPIIYEVDRTRDGRSFTTRRVAAVQHGRAIFTMSASFQTLETGFEHQEPMPATGDPDQLPALDDPRAKAWSAIDLRFVPRDDDNPRDQQVWLRAAGTMPDEALTHVCVLAYASDLTLLSSTLGPHGVDRGDRNLRMASLDHAMWFHRPFRVDDWLLYDQVSPAAAGGRGLAAGRIFTTDGTLVASVVQEGLVRVRAPAFGGVVE